ncbi:MAG: Uma2 family endonuclease [Xenococcus sp. MO_188.B8]|nr:Uma2 family endonuclease [Xenococcus sp. MO_188.B8]
MAPITLNLQPTIELTDEQFALICSTNRDLRLERTATGELVIMPPTGGETGKRNSSINAQLWFWNQQHKLGEVFDSSTGFKLPNGATRSPDAAWIKKERWESLTSEQQKKFIPLCPDFVVELRSNSDNLSDLQQKMKEYLANGLVLGWLIDPQNKKVEVYKSNCSVEVISNPVSLSGENTLSGFTLNLKDIF